MFDSVPMHDKLSRKIGPDVVPNREVVNLYALASKTEQDKNEVPG